MKIIGATLLLSLVAASQAAPCGCGLDPMPQEQQVVNGGVNLVMEPMLMPFPFMYMMEQPIGGLNFGFNSQYPSISIGPAAPGVDNVAKGPESTAPEPVVEEVKVNDGATVSVTGTVVGAAVPEVEAKVDNGAASVVTETAKGSVLNKGATVTVTSTGAATPGQEEHADSREHHEGSAEVDHKSSAESTHIDHKHHHHGIAIEGSSSSSSHHKGGFDLEWMKTHLDELKNFAMKGSKKLGGSIGGDASIDLSKGKASIGGFDINMKHAVDLMPTIALKGSAGSGEATVKIGKGDMKLGGSIGGDASIDLSKGKASIGGFDINMKHAVDLMPTIALKGSAGSGEATVKIGKGDMKLGGSIGGDASINLSKGKASIGGFDINMKHAVDLMPTIALKGSAGSGEASMKIGGSEMKLGGDIKLGGSIGGDASIDLSKGKASIGGFGFGLKKHLDVMPTIALMGSADHIEHTLEMPEIMPQIKI